MKTRDILFFAFLSLHIISCKSGINKEAGKEDIAVYSIKLPDKKDIREEDFHQTITLDGQKKIHKLDFGKFSTISTLTISRENKPDSILFSQHKNPGERQVIDMTEWGKGTYRVQFTAIAESVTFWLEVK